MTTLAYKHARSYMRYIYVSRPGGKPLNIGMNAAKRRAARLDKQDRAVEVKTFDWTVPKHDRHHTQLVLSRHRYYREIEVAATEFVPHFPHASGSGPRECARGIRGQQSAT
jgi:hypothetical protein